MKKKTDFILSLRFIHSLHSAFLPIIIIIIIIIIIDQ